MKNTIKVIIGNKSIKELKIEFINQMIELE